MKAQYRVMADGNLMMWFEPFTPGMREELERDMRRGLLETEFERLPDELFVIPPGQIGALTESILLTDDLRDLKRVWWFPAYAIRSYLDDILRRGYAVWELG